MSATVVTVCSRVDETSTIRIQDRNALETDGRADRREAAVPL